MGERVAASGSASFDAVGVTSSAPAFVGRERELGLIDQALARGPAVVLVEGEAGIGKSRLIQQLSHTHREATERWLVVGCPPFHEPLTLGPVVDALRLGVRRVGGLPLSGLAGALRPLFPEWNAELPPAPEPLDDARAARHRLFRALVELLGCLDITGLVVEDVHWADETSLEFLLFLAVARPQPVTLIVTYRREDLPADSLLRRLSTRLPPGSTQLRLAVEPLNAPECGWLVSSMLDGSPISPRFTEFLHQHTGGNPLMIEESVRLMYDRADLIHHEGEWIRRRLDGLEVPHTVRDAVLERAGRLSVAARQILRGAAVLETPTDETILLTVTGLPTEQAEDGLTEAVDSGLLQQDSRGLVSYRHALASRAVRDATPTSKRRALHLRAAHALTDVAPPPVARLAQHFRYAGQTTEWAHYAELAADQALASADDGTAVTVLHDLLTGADLPAATITRLLKKIPYVAFNGADRYYSLVSTLRSKLDTQALGPQADADIRVQLGRLLCRMGEYDAGRAELERAVPNLGHDPTEAGLAMLLLGWPRGTSPGSTHLQWFRRAAEIAPSVAPTHRQRYAYDRICGLLLLGVQDGWEEAAAQLDRPTAGNDLLVPNFEVNLGDRAMRWGRYADARRFLVSAAEGTDRHQSVRLREVVAVTEAHLDYFVGHWDGLAERAEALALDDDLVAVTRSEALLVTALLHAVRGEPELAEQQLREVLASLRPLGAVDYHMEPAAALARLHLADGRVGDALKATDESMQILLHKGIWLWATEIAPVRTQALLAAGRAEEAADIVARFTRGLRDCDAATPHAALAECQAILAEHRFGPARAAEPYGRATAAWESLPRPYEALLAGERQAYCLLAAKQTQPALSLLSQVFNRLSELDARPDAERVMQRLQQHGVQVKRPAWFGGRRSYGDQLSPRELDVARLVLHGHTNRQIAEELFVSPRTVGRHIDAAMRKLNVTSRTALAVKVVEERLLPDAST